MQLEPSNSPILVTGSHRSGSTWVGSTLAYDSSIGFIQEPFHILTRPGICNAQFDNWFTYVCEENEAVYQHGLSECVQFNFQWQAEFRTIQSLKDIVRLARDSSIFTYYKMVRKRALMKDPIAFFSAEWLFQRFHCDMVVMIRNPYAFVGSIKTANWEHPFNHFLNQPLLMRDYLSPFRTQIETYAVEKQDIVDQAILLWNIFHHVLSIYQEKYPNWIYIRHEDISQNPTFEFERLYQKLNLRYSDNIKEKNPKIINRNC